MLEIEPSEEVEEYARAWQKEFPLHRITPELVGRWLCAYPKEETIELAKHYLDLDCKLDNLYRFILLVCQSDVREEFRPQLSALLEKNPDNFVWSVAFNDKDRDIEMFNTLGLRWLKLNWDNPEAYPDSMALFTKSPVVLAEILLWTKTAGLKAKYMPRTLGHLFYSIPGRAPELLKELIDFCRDWIRQNENREDVEFVISHLISFTRSQDDRDYGVSWIQNQNGQREIWSVLCSILNLDRKENKSPDSYILNKTKELLQGLDYADRPPAIVRALLSVDKSPETIQIAKETYFEWKAPYLLIGLLPEHSDEKLIAAAQSQLKRFPEHPQDELLLALIKADCKNKTTIKLAKSFLKNFPDHTKSNDVRKLLSI